MPNCKVRIWVPDDPNEDWGFYDLYFDQTMSFTTNISINMPVFSYEEKTINGVRATYVGVYPSANTPTYCPAMQWHGGECWEYTFSVSRDEFNNLLDQIGDCSEFAGWDEDNQLLIRRMTEGAFKDYSGTKSNSFAAAAHWANWLGNGALLADYNAAHDRAYLNYAPEKLYEIYGPQWTASSLDG